MRAVTLLGHLAQFKAFYSQGELLCTQGLVQILRTHADAHSALAKVVEVRTGIRIGQAMHWHAEVIQEDRGRPDLELRTGAGIPLVKIEAKLGAGLDHSQLQSYAADLERRGGEGVLLVLVPARRSQEAAGLASDALGLSGPGPWHASETRRLGVAVLSWDDLFTALREGASNRYLCELEQLESMYRVLIGDDIAPLAGLDDLIHWRERETDFVNIVDQATRDLTTEHKAYPMGVETLEQVTEGLEPKGYRRRYVCRSYKGTQSCFSIGVRDSFGKWVTPVWMRFHEDTPHFAHIRSNLAASSLRNIVSGGHVWLPLVPIGETKDSMVDSLVKQAEEVLRIAYANP
jgi:hypothetical protein